MGIKPKFDAWPAICADRAQQAIGRGAEVFRLPASISSDDATFHHGLQTARGACYVISDAVFPALGIAEDSLVSA